MKFSMLFLFCTCFAHNLGGKKTSFEEIKKWLGSEESEEPAFCKSKIDLTVMYVIIFKPIRFRLPKIGLCSLSLIKQVLQAISMIFLWYFHDLLGVYMIFCMLFLFCTCFAPSLGENKTSFEKIKRLGSDEPEEPAFCKSKIDLTVIYVTIFKPIKFRFTKIGLCSLSLIKQVLQAISMIFLWYFNDLLGVYMIFSMLFLFCTCFAHILGENKTSFEEIKKRLGSEEPEEPAFCKSKIDLTVIYVIIFKPIKFRLTKIGLWICTVFLGKM